MLLRDPATGLLLSGSYGGYSSDIAQCQSSNALNLEAKSILGIVVQCLMVSRIDDTDSFTTNMRSGANFTFELLEQSEVGQGQEWPALKAAAIAAYKARSGGGGAVGGGGGGGGGGR